MAADLKTLISKLNDTTRKALESAAGLCVNRGHYDVDLEHLLIKLIERDNTDIHRILGNYEIDPGRLEKDLSNALDRFKSGNTRTPALSPNIPKAFELAWVAASIDFASHTIRSGHVLLAALENTETAALLRSSSKLFDKIQVADLRAHFADIVHGSDEQKEQVVAETAAAAAEPPGTPKPPGKTPALDQFTVNLTARAKAGKVDPVLGRDREIRQMIDILMRRRQNNPILTGEAGVGKTAVVEGLALRIADGDVPPPLAAVVLHTLDLGLLQAGASVKGEFENRLRGVIDEVKGSPHPIILFIDEAHTLIGAGGAAGQGDAANLLKPALARGELRTIAATTWSEYKKYFEKDAALARRFQVVKIDEPTEAQATDMLRGVVKTMEAHHHVRILDEATIAAAKLSNRYLSGRQLPDKAVSVLDTASARVAIGQASLPGAIEDRVRRIQALETEHRVLEREVQTGADHSKRLAEVDAELARLNAERSDLETRWEKEKAVVARLIELREKIEDAKDGAKEGAGDTPQDSAPVSADEKKAMLDEMEGLKKEYAALVGESPLVPYCVDAGVVGEVISAWTGIPVGKMVRNEIETVMKLKEHLEERVIGQSHALEAIAKRIKTSRANLTDPDKPIGVFMLIGPSGVGKTETAIALADLLYGGERNMVTIAMSEFQEAHTVSLLKGSPPGYVGYGEGGVLTEAVRRKPYSVVLLDEVEKAHPDVLELFFQVFDKGRMDDAEGREIDFRNTVIILTSNVGTDLIMQECLEAQTMPPADALVGALRPQLNRAFKPAFIGRLNVIPYYPVKDEVLRRIIQLKLGKIERRFHANHGAQLACGDDVVSAIAARCTEVDSGARNIDNILTGTLLPEMSSAVLAKMADGAPISKVTVSVDDQQQFAYAIE